MGKARDGAEAALGGDRLSLLQRGTVKRDTNQHLVLQSQVSLLLPGKGLLSLGLFGGHKRKGGQETRTIYFIPGLLVIV